MPFFLAGLALLLLFLLLRGWFANANPANLARTLTMTGAVLALIIGLALTLLGRSAAGLPLLFIALSLFGRLFQLTGGTQPSSPAGRSSGVETDWLVMQLDHATGLMRGEVRRGRLSGRRLETLTPGETIELIGECGGSDPQSAQLLAAWLDRSHPGWREQSHEKAEAAPSGAMSVAEAYAILGLQPGADEAAVRRAYRELMRRNHPDSGGSSWLAARINEARDVLLGGK